jgi:hypothetical protein
MEDACFYINTPRVPLDIGSDHLKKDKVERQIEYLRQVADKDKRRRRRKGVKDKARKKNTSGTTTPATTSTPPIPSPHPEPPSGVRLVLRRLHRTFCEHATLAQASSPVLIGGASIQVTTTWDNASGVLSHKTEVVFDLGHLHTTTRGADKYWGEDASASESDVRGGSISDEEDSGGVVDHEFGSDEDGEGGSEWEDWTDEEDAYDEIF